MSIDPAQNHVMPKVILIGFGFTSFSALVSLSKSCKVLSVFTDNESTSEYAAANQIAKWMMPNLSELPALLEQAKPDVVVISSFNQILSAKVLATSRFINVHYAPLPRYRGRANVNWAIINNEHTSGISIHFVNPGLDSGNILYQEEITIGATDNVASLYDRLNAIQERELGPAVLRAVTGDRGLPQEEHNASYCCGRLPIDGEIDWGQSTAAIDRLIRALVAPFPLAFTHLDCRPLKIAKAEPVAYPPHFAGRVPGRIIRRSSNQGWVEVLTGDGVMRLHEVILDAGEVMQAAKIISSTRMTLGLSNIDLRNIIADLEERLSKLELAFKNQHS